MKIIPLILFLFVIPACAQAQGNNNAQRTIFELNFGAGSNHLRGKLPGLSNQFSPFFYTELKANFEVQGKLFLATGIAFQSALYIVDGYFFDSSGARFSKLRGDMRLSDLTMRTIELPVLLRKIITGDSRNGLAVSGGGYFAYLVNKKHRYKLGDTKYENRFPVDNNLQWGLIFDAGTFGRGKQGLRTGTSFGFGVKAQMSEFINSGRSFIPVHAYLRLGVTM